MQLTHLGHSTLLVETDGYRLLIDPGCFTPEWETLQGINAIVVTHDHPDHYDATRIEPLIAANPGVVVACEAELAAGTAAPHVTHTLTPGNEYTFGPFTATTTGGQHATIHPDIPNIGNVGVILAGPDGTTLYHPGDELNAPIPNIDVLAVPINGPWCAVEDTVEFIRTCAPASFVPIHDALLSAVGRNLYVTLLNNLTAKDITLRDLADRTPVTV